MIKNTLSNIRHLIQDNTQLDTSDHQKLKELVEQLHVEIYDEPSLNRDDAKSIVGYTEMALHESSRENKNQQLHHLSLEGLQASIADFETSHPMLYKTVNAIYLTLNKMGL